MSVPALDLVSECAWPQACWPGADKLSEKAILTGNMLHNDNIRNGLYLGQGFFIDLPSVVAHDKHGAHNRWWGSRVCWLTPLANDVS